MARVYSFDIACSGADFLREGAFFVPKLSILHVSLSTSIEMRACGDCAGSEIG